MAINKVVYGNSTLMDLTSDTVTPSDVLNSKSFHDASGTLRTGSADISGKADKVSNATSGDLAGLDSNGNLTDSGIAASAVITSSKVGANNGVASLDANGKVPNGQLGIAVNPLVPEPDARLSIFNFKGTNYYIPTADVDINLIDMFTPSNAYSIGDYCFYFDSSNNVICYKCTTAHTGSWDISHFTAVKVLDEVQSNTNAISGLSSNAYSTSDTAETTLDDADYVPFYDSSATAKRKSLWSNIKSVLKTYFDTLYSNKISSPTSGKFVYADSNGVLYSSSYDAYNLGGNTSYLEDMSQNIQFTYDGQTISETMSYQALNVSSIGTMSSYEEVRHTWRLSQTVTLSTSQDSTVVFGGEIWPHLSSFPEPIIDTGAKENVTNITTSISDIGYKSCEVDLTNHICTVVFPPYSSAASMTVDLYMY